MCEGLSASHWSRGAGGVCGGVCGSSSWSECGCSSECVSASEEQARLPVSRCSHQGARGAAEGDPKEELGTGDQGSPSHLCVCICEWGTSSWSGTVASGAHISRCQQLGSGGSCWAHWLSPAAGGTHIVYMYIYSFHTKRPSSCSARKGNRMRLLVLLVWVLCVSVGIDLCGHLCVYVYMQCISVLCVHVPQY